MNIDFETIKQQNNLITIGDKIFVKPLSKYNYVTYPIEELEGTILVTLEEYLGLRVNYYCFNDNLTGLEITVPVK